MLEAIRLCLWAATALLFVASAATFLSWQGDRDVLQIVAREIVAGRATDRDRATALARWVDRRGNDPENRQYFLLPGLGATPVQVLRYGGDAADRARLRAQLMAAAGLGVAPALADDPEGLVATALLAAAVLAGALAASLNAMHRSTRRPARQIAENTAF